MFFKMSESTGWFVDANRGTRIFWPSFHGDIEFPSDISHGQDIGDVIFEVTYVTVPFNFPSDFFIDPLPLDFIFIPKPSTSLVLVSKPGLWKIFTFDWVSRRIQVDFKP